MSNADTIWKTRDCFDCRLKRDDLCYWGLKAFRITVHNPDGTVHKRKNCLKRWQRQPENHVELSEKGS